MEFFIKTEKDLTYSQLHKCGVIDATGREVDGIDIKFNADEGYFEAWKDGKAIRIREGLYEIAADKGELVKLDFKNMKRPRRVSMEQIKNAPVQQSSETIQEMMEDFNPELFEVTTTKLRDINFDPKLFEPIKTGTYFDTFASKKGGIMPGINIMLTGDPGVGKSSNLMDILVNVKKEDPTKKVLYISAEMNEVDVQEFTEYYPGLEDIEFLYISKFVTDPSLNIKPYQALMSVLHKGYDLVVMDSIVEVQSMVQEDLGMSTKKGERWILDLMNRHNEGHNVDGIYSTFLCIQQKTKGGTYVGSKRLEHMTSAFLNLCWDTKEPGKRYMVFEKNRKGKEKVKLYYGFAGTEGIAYDEVRHSKEQEILERLQSPEKFGVEEFNPLDFEELFKTPDENSSEI